MAIMDWYSRYAVARRLSNTLEAGFCADALSEALGRGKPERSTPTRGASSPARGSPGSFRTRG